MNFKPTFNPAEVIDSFHLDELTTGKTLCAFLDSITQRQQDQAIVTRWANWFAKKGVPWAITLKNNNYQLWKIDDTLSNAQIKKERLKDVRWFAETEHGEERPEPYPDPEKQSGVCRCEGCKDEAKCDGLCMACYSRRRKQELKGKVFDYVRKPRASRVDVIDRGLEVLGELGDVGRELFE